MATIQTIATTLTADARPAVASLRTFDAEVGKAFTRLDRLNKRALPTGGLESGRGFSQPTFQRGAASELNAIGRGGTMAAQVLLEASRAAEDFAVGFGVNGIQGAIRGSMNNLTQMAMMFGGPLTGAIAGFTAAGVSALSPYIAKLFEAEDRTKRLAQETDNLLKKARELFELRVKEAEVAIDFRIERKGGDDKSVLDEIGKRRQELEKLEARRQEIEQRQPEAADPVRNAERVELLQREAELRREIAKIQAAPNGAQADDDLARRLAELEKIEAKRRALEHDPDENPERLRLLEREAELRKEIGALQVDVPQERESITGSIENRVLELEKLQARMRELDAARERNDRLRINDTPIEAVGGGVRLFGGANDELIALKDREQKAEEENSRLMQEKLELLRKETELRVQIGQLRRRETELTKEQMELQRQKDAEEFANIIRKFQEEDEHDAEREARDREKEARDREDKVKRELIRDNDRIQGLLKQQFGRLGEQADPLDGLWVPDELRGQLEGLFSEMAGVNAQRGSRLAQVATADSQSLLRAQQQAKEAAKAERQRQQLVEKVSALLEEFKRLRRELEPQENQVDVNLN